ncbi:hypothetical protein [Desulfatibacillum aliphaticivorans]|uniref:hypothetical protein n=1 Tax=Desulfatibacillum aliphaticivorans TaxID=218208 RepID=UPI000551E4B7|nr:hypothetical protein [Desulfatibacillum aliphaticivorans]
MWIKLTKSNKTKLFFTSDHHFGHEAIIRFCNRPFESHAEMDAELIRRWNEVVDFDDVVFHLGDFTLRNKKDARHYFSRLRGNIKVLGNLWHHDKGWLPRKPGPSDLQSRSGTPIEILPPIIVVDIKGLVEDNKKQRIVLCHYPLAEWDAMHYGAYHLYGHTHGNHVNLGLSFDIGVDCTNFYPMEFSDVVEKFNCF